jgi:hypothetical protein
MSSGANQGTDASLLQGWRPTKNSPVAEMRTGFMASGTAKRSSLREEDPEITWGQN